ncbi:MAG: hypothetical protein IPM27_05845 [Nitrosomonadales bacterium]|nr:hypothetical protein [Nitrosomonadales bacterium]
MASHDAWALVCRLFSGGTPLSHSTLSPSEIAASSTLGKAVKPAVLNQTHTLCPYCQLHRCQIWGDGKGGRICHCPECGQVSVQADDLAALELDQEWFRAKLRLAMDINSRDGIIDLGADVWHLGDARSAPVVLARSLMKIWREPTILDRVRVKDGNIRVIAPRHREARGEPLGHGVQWLSLEERFAFYGGGITYTPVAETAGMSVVADPTTPVFGPFSADFRWVTLDSWSDGAIHCTPGQAAVFKALWEFKGEWRRGEQVMLRAKLNSTKPSDVFKAARYEGPRHAYQTLVDTQEREGLYAMPCAAKR